MYNLIINCHFTDIIHILAQCGGFTTLKACIFNMIGFYKHLQVKHIVCYGCKGCQ